MNGAGTGMAESTARLTLRVRLPALTACDAVVPGIATPTTALFLAVATAARMTARTTTAYVWFVTPPSVGWFCKEIIKKLPQSLKFESSSN